MPSLPWPWTAADPAFTHLSSDGNGKQTKNVHGHRSIALTPKTKYPNGSLETSKGH